MVPHVMVGEFVVLEIWDPKQKDLVKYCGLLSSIDLYQVTIDGMECSQIKSTDRKKMSFSFKQIFRLINGNIIPIQDRKEWIKKSKRKRIIKQMKEGFRNLIGEKSW